MSKNYTIEDIAKELGVSKTTVSRALSGKGRIGKETAERVRKAAEQYGYRPNVLAKGLAQKKTYNLGLIIPEEKTDTERRFFRECMDGICEETSKHDYDVLLAIMTDDRLHQMRRMILNNKVDGIILTRTILDSETVALLKEYQMPFVVIGPLSDTEIVSIDNPNREASRELTGLLLMKGLQRLALVGGEGRHYVTKSRRDGFVEAHQERGIQMQNHLMFMEVDDYHCAMRSVEHILASGADGIICMDDFICGLILGCLREKRIKVPSMIRVASMYDSPQMAQNNPAVTSIQFDTRELGRRACMKMLEMLGEDMEYEHRRLSYQVVLRESTK